jgi:hypothetical protein
MTLFSNICSAHADWPDELGQIGKQDLAVVYCRADTLYDLGWSSLGSQRVGIGTPKDRQQIPVTQVSTGTGGGTGRAGQLSSDVSAGDDVSRISSGV